MKGHKAGLFIFTFIVLLVTWFWITGSFEMQEITAGIIVALGIAAATAAVFTVHGLDHLAPRRLLYLLLYVPYYFYQVILANLDVVYSVLAPLSADQARLCHCANQPQNRLWKTGTGKFHHPYARDNCRRRLGGRSCSYTGFM